MRAPPTVGVLCRDCSEDLSCQIEISPEQVQLRGSTSSTAALVDKWGRTHGIDVQTRIGRCVEDHGLAILEPSVSRQHAMISEAGGVWRLSDLGSANGTFLDGRLVECATPVGHRDRVHFGFVGFFFLSDASHLELPRSSRTIHRTVSPPLESLRPTLEIAAPSTAGLRCAAIALQEPVGGGGGVFEVDDKQAQLTPLQFELVGLLLNRLVTEAHLDEEVRGFVRSSELVKLSLDSTAPDEDHVRHLIRRVRAVVRKAGMGELVESRHGLGYRLRVIPRLR